jgi:hypothetical protein
MLLSTPIDNENHLDALEQLMKLLFEQELLLDLDFIQQYLRKTFQQLTLFIL